MSDVINRGNHARRIISQAVSPEVAARLSPEELEDAMFYDFPVLRRQPKSLWRTSLCLPCLFVSVTVALMMALLAAKYW